MHLSTRLLEWLTTLKNTSLLLVRCSKAAILVVFACCFLFQVIAGAQVKETRRVLILTDLGITASPGFAEVVQALWAGLQKSPYHIELYQESLELTLFPAELHQGWFRKEFIRKYSDRKPDVIITAGPGSLKFVAESNESFLRDSPIVFCAILGQIPDRLRPDMHFTGVLARLRPEETLGAALHLLPSTKHVVVTGGMGEFDQGWEAIARQSFHNYESKLDFTYLTDLSMPALLERLRNLPKDTIVYHTSITQDASGDHFIDSADAVPLVASAANAPVFVMDDVDLRGGTVGGDLVNWADDARVTAEMAVRVLNGEKPEDVRVVTSNNFYMFDWRALKRWGMKESNLPPGSIVLNRQPTFWEAYKRYVLAAFFVLLAQSVAILALLWQRAQTRKTQIELSRSEEKFSKAFQRSPLAFTLASLVDYRFVEVNDTFEAYTGWHRDEVIGRTPMQIKFWHDTNQRSVFLERIRAQRTVREMEILFRTKDGQVRTGLVSSELIDLNGEPCVLSLIADITDAKRAEAARRESEDRFRLVANTAPVMIWMSATDKLCNYFNQPWLDFTGRSIEAELGNGWTEMVHPDDFQACLDTYQRAFDRHETFQMEYRLRRHDGEYRWLVDIGVPRLNPDGSFAGYIGSCIDVTDRKLAEEALATVGRRLIEAHEEERTWIGRELHDDINQRLALLAVELDQWKKESSRDVLLLDRFQHAQQRISEIAMDVQALSHRLHSSKLDYLGLAVAAKSFCRELSEKAKVEIAFSHAEVPSTLPKEVSLCLFRVMQEALQNAVKYSGVQTFKVDLRGTQDSVELTIADSGRGFEEHDALSRQGLGLISMRERIQIVHGELKVQSKPGSGTTIYALVPLKTREYRAVAS